MTTRGHGVFAQYSPEHYKEWICKENRRLERGASPERHVFDPANSLHRSSLYEPMGLRDEAQNIEHRHHAMTKSLKDLRQYQTAPNSGGLTIQTPSKPLEVATRQPLSGDFLPHSSHHHHFGWNAPTPEARIPAAPETAHANYYKMGSAQKYNQQVFFKASLISTRKV
ncbi:hypothetical protein V8C86DRAFT_2557615 [Haematococcus lacustris]